MNIYAVWYTSDIAGNWVDSIWLTVDAAAKRHAQLIKNMEAGKQKTKLGTSVVVMELEDAKLCTELIP